VLRGNQIVKEKTYVFFKLVKVHKKAFLNAFDTLLKPKPVYLRDEKAGGEVQSFLEFFAFSYILTVTNGKKAQF